MTIWRKFTIGFLLAQSIGAGLWDICMLGWPEARTAFLATGMPDVTLLAFLAPDAIGFVGTAALAAYGFWKGRAWAMTLLCIHAGAAGYAALYCWSLVALTGGQALAGALLMTPALLLPAFLIVRLRHEESPRC